MCDRCILDNTAYICNWCYDELVADSVKWPGSMTAAEVRRRIEEFMASPVGARRVLKGEELDREFWRLTGGEAAADSG